MSMQILYIQTRPYTLYLFTPTAFGPGLAGMPLGEELCVCGQRDLWLGSDFPVRV